MSGTLKTQERALKVIFDSNALFVPLRFKIDIFEDLKALLNRNFMPILISPVRREIERMARMNSSKAQREAACALKLAEKCKLIEVEKEESSVDDIIVEVAQELHAPVFTNDAQLRKRLRNINVPVIYVRQKSRLEIDGRL
jgi:rRNA-processing protein FCF1